ncbi:hypothetical protein FA002_04805 [Priestia megaterium]|nr:hypothetical protein C1Y47_12645 [Priestia megaterium]TJZ40904.1 hypothetical protein FA002_04805 [Priestia megaterium]
MPSNQQLEATEYTKSTFTITMKKSERVGFFIKNLDSSFGFFLTKILLSQPLVITTTLGVKNLEEPEPFYIPLEFPTFRFVP